MPYGQITLPAGTTVRDPDGQRYLIERVLAKKDTGAVYLVKSRSESARYFTLQEMINPPVAEREHFFFESEVLRRLRHRALPRMYHLFEHEQLKRVYMVTDYIEGRNLEELRREQPEQCFNLFEALNLLAPVVDALYYLHTQTPPIIHRDVKPASIVVPKGAHETMLVNFGLVKEYVAGATTTLIRRGTPGYAAPEQYMSGTSPQTDIYGLGATLYTLLTGRVPPDAVTRVFNKKGIDTLKSVSDLVPTVPETISAVIERAMALNPEERFASVEEFWRALFEHRELRQVQSKAISTIDSPVTNGPQNVATPPPATTILPHLEPSPAHKKKQAVPTWLGRWMAFWRRLFA